MKSKTKNKMYVFEENFFNGSLDCLWGWFLEPGETGMRDTYIFLKAISQEQDSKDGFFYYDSELIAKRTSLQICQVDNYARVLKQMGLLEIREDKPKTEEKEAVFSVKVNEPTNAVIGEAFNRGKDIWFIDYS